MQQAADVFGVSAGHNNFVKTLVGQKDVRRPSVIAVFGVRVKPEVREVRSTVDVGTSLPSHQSVADYCRRKTVHLCSRLVFEERAHGDFRSWAKMSVAPQVDVRRSECNEEAW